MRKTRSAGIDAGAHDLGAVVDVVEEGVQRPRPLLHAALEPAPLGLGEDPRHHVEGDQPLGVAALAVDREGDADAAEQRLGLLLLLREHLGRGGLDPVHQPGIGRTDLVAVEHLVEGADPRLPRAPRDQLNSTPRQNARRDTPVPDAARAAGAAFAPRELGRHPP